jgi:histone-lysine N-methyltransferase SETMAR
MISSAKLIVTIAWNPNGFHVIEVLPKGQKFNTDYYCSSVLAKPSKIATRFRNETRRKLILPADNAPPHTAKSSIEFWAKLYLKVVPHLPYSPDLAPSDYLLFGYIKANREACPFRQACTFIVQ